MAYTQAQVTALEEAIASGVLSVRQTDGRSVTYQSLSEMRAVLQEMRNEVNAAAGTRRRRTFRTFQQGRGT